MTAGAVEPNISCKAHHCSVRREESCCHPEKKEKRTIVDDIVEIAGKISMVGLMALACYMNWKAFVPYFVVGTGIGLYKFSQAEPTRPGGSPPPCQQGLIEGITGVKLPPMISLAINIAIAVAHLMHHLEVFGPLFALSGAAWFGYNLGHYADQISK